MANLLFDGLRPPLTEIGPDPDPAATAELSALAEKVTRGARRRLGRSLSIRQVDAGSCNACELEINALGNSYYDLERFGLRFVASPRHADVLLVTGPVTRNMKEALERTYQAMPNPKWVVAAGNCAGGCGVFSENYACIGAVAEVIPVDLHIAGCPPTPTQLLAGLLSLLELNTASATAAADMTPRREPPTIGPPPRVKAPPGKIGIGRRQAFWGYVGAMNRLAWRDRMLGVGVALLVGYVDAVGFLRSGGFYVVSMNANATQFGVNVAQGSGRAVYAADLIGAFVVGVVCGSVVGHLARAHRRGAVLALVAVLLAAAAGLDTIMQTVGAVTAMALAMGAVNAVFEGAEKEGSKKTSGPISSKTCAAVGLAREFWMFEGWNIILWIGFVVGALLGAAANLHLGVVGFWMASAAAAFLASCAQVLRPAQVSTRT